MRRVGRVNRKSALCLLRYRHLNQEIFASFSRRVTKRNQLRRTEKRHLEKEKYANQKTDNNQTPSNFASTAGEI